MITRLSPLCIQSSINVCVPMVDDHEYSRSSIFLDTHPKSSVPSGGMCNFTTFSSSSSGYDDST